MEEQFTKSQKIAIAIIFALGMLFFYWAFCEAWEYDGWAHSRDAFPEFVEQDQETSEAWDVEEMGY